MHNCNSMQDWKAVPAAPKNGTFQGHKKNSTMPAVITKHQAAVFPPSPPKTPLWHPSLCAKTVKPQNQAATVPAQPSSDTAPHSHANMHSHGVPHCSRQRPARTKDQHSPCCPAAKRTRAVVGRSLVLAACARQGLGRSASGTYGQAQVKGPPAASSSTCSCCTTSAMCGLLSGFADQQRSARFW